MNSSEDLRTRLQMSIRMQAPCDVLRLAVLARLYLAVSVIYTQVAAMTAPATLLYQALAKSVPFGVLGVWVLVAVASVAVLDVVVNDWMPDRFELPTAYAQRHLVYMGLAMGLASISFVLTKSNGWGVLQWRYLLDAAAAVAIAFNDLLARHRSPK